MKAALMMLLVCGLAVASATTYFKDTVEKDWKDTWVVSDNKKSEGTAGTWKRITGDWYGDAEASHGLQTSQDARFYSITKKFDKPFSSVGKDLVLQFSIKHPQKIDCGGGYIKLLPSDVDQKNFNGDSPYLIMFGPDICGTSTKKTHVIFNYKGKNLLTKKNIPAETDQLTHVYTLIVHGADQTYEVRIDGEKKESGSLYDDWDFLPPKTIKDPSVSKPKDWVDDPLIDDPEDVKPADWDKTPKQIPDPEAEKPEDWDDEADGEWEAPVIDNPEWKGEWKPKRIANPAYKGKWVHPEISNPDYVEDKTIGQYDNIGAVGIEIWQVKAGTIFDNFLVTDSVSEAEAFLATTYEALKGEEKRMFDEAEKVRTAKEEADRKKAEEERKSQEAKKKTEEEEDEEEEEEEEEKPAHDEL